MIDDDFERLQAVFLEALTLPAVERARFLDRACAGAPELRVQVEDLLRHSENPASIVRDRDQEPWSAAGDIAAQRGPEVEGFDDLTRIGTGGMGIVYRAMQRHPRRAVALKIMRLDVCGPEIERRFRRETKLLAQLQHPGIAQVFGAGTFTSEFGEAPYYVMELIDGLPIDRFCSEHGLDRRARCALLARVCDAAQHAHEHGIVHRDLKPSNILVVPDAGSGPQPKILDFGIARRAATEPLDSMLQTRTGQLMGTLPYMSPEQVGGAAVDHRTDVYSLGVIAYVLLAGKLPLDLEGLSLAEITHSLRDDEPEPLRRVDSTLRGDLETIVGRALAKDRSQRYVDARAMAADLRRHLEHRPILARPPTRRYRIAKFARRHRALVALGVVLLLASIVSAFFAVRAHRDRARAERSAADLRPWELLQWPIKLDQAVAVVDALPVAWPEHEARFAEFSTEYGEPLLASSAQVDPAIETLASEPALNDERRFLLATLRGFAAARARFVQRVWPGVVAGTRWSREVERCTVLRHADRWRAAREAIRRADGVSASRLYASAGLDLAPQIGLVPLGPNPVTRLWEFYHLRSAWDPDGVRTPEQIPIPELRPDGGIDVDEATGIVFVLLPGGTFTMGCQSRDPAAANYDPQATEADGPPHRVTLDPFFLARHELTRAQCERLLARKVVWDENDPTIGEWFKEYRPCDPATRIDWPEAVALLARHGLRVPAEAQWEYACRAGSQTPHFFSPPEVITTYAKVAASPTAYGHQPVGRLRPNPFGLFDLYGNVWEWCGDENTSYAAPVRGDGLREGDPGISRVMRGSGFGGPDDQARSGARHLVPPATRYGNQGLRAARAILPARRH